MIGEEDTSVLAGLLKAAIVDFVAERTDRRGFSKLGPFIDLLRSASEEEKRRFAEAIDFVVDETGDAPAAFWQAIYLLVEKIGKFSNKLGEKIIANLDATICEEIDEDAATSRYYKFQVYMAAGGRLSALRLRDEKSFRSNTPVLWYNLMVNIFEGSPLSIIDVTVECVKSTPPQLTIQDIFLRLNKYFDVLGKDFNHGMQEIAEALTGFERLSFASTLKRRFGLTVIHSSKKPMLDTEGPISSVASIRSLVREELQIFFFEMAQFGTLNKDKGLNSGSGEKYINVGGATNSDTTKSKEASMSDGNPLEPSRPAPKVVQLRNG